jgi:DNA-directed RNA polymerase beta' subunit
VKVLAVRAYEGPVERDGMVPVYDVTVEPSNRYVLAAGIVVSNSKRISLLDVNALLSHGATETLRDAGAVRGQRNEEFWLQYMMGLTPRQPRVPMVYEKFVNQLRAAGVNVVRDGAQLHVMALTARDVAELAGDRVVRSGDTVRFDKDMEPVAGGLFDPKLTGGHGGNRWAAIDLSEPLPNPVMEEPIRRLLGLTGKEFEAVLAGEHVLAGYGTGPQALHEALKKYNVPRETARARVEMTSGSRAKRDAAVRRLGYLKGLQKTGMTPADWVLPKVPVLPPAFRPVSVMGDSGTPLVSDANYLYKELLDADKNLREMRKEVGDEGVGDERLAVYHAFKAVTGLGEPVSPKLQEKRVGGILKSVFGSSPKFGTVQRKLISSTVDNVGRAVISPNPDLDMDSVGLPEDKAFDVYGKFVARRLRRRGMPLAQAVRAVKDRAPLAKEMLLEEMNARPVFINRAPVLHKFGIMAFRPQLVSGSTMQVSPLIVKGFNADFDGDAMQFHVPTTDEAVAEAYDRMLPSKNLLAPADFKTPVHVPSQEYLGGLYHASAARKEKARPRVFARKADLMGAINRGEVDADDPVEILEG